MIVILDYGVGNLKSVHKALVRVGAEAAVSSDPASLDAARGVVLPGVGAFGDAMRNLTQRGLVRPLMDQVHRGKPLLGICLGMQLLFGESEEMGRHQGLGVLPGTVLRFPDVALTVPHVGWNQLRRASSTSASPILDGIPDGAYAYFVHSYYVVPSEAGDVAATTAYGPDFASVVRRGSIWGAQFHPEKSQEVGLALLENFVRLVRTQ
jgi:glutamine amidotransferase